MDESNNNSSSHPWENETIAHPGDEYSIKKEKENAKINLISQIILYIFLAIGLIVYVSISYYNEEYWASLWVLILAGPIISSIYFSIAHGRMTEFLYPLFCVAIYCSIGYIYNLWHPFWLIFITIPVYYTIANFVDKIKRKKD